MNNVQPAYEMNDEQWADYLLDVLKHLSTHAEQLPPDATALRELIQATCEPLSCLIGYFISGISDDPGGST